MNGALELLSTPLVRYVAESGSVRAFVEKAKGVRIEEKWVQLDSPIKKIGDYDITLKMTGGSECTFKLTVLPESDNA